MEETRVISLGINERVVLAASKRFKIEQEKRQQYLEQQGVRRSYDLAKRFAAKFLNICDKHLRLDSTSLSSFSDDELAELDILLLKQLKKNWLTYIWSGRSYVAYRQEFDLPVKLIRMEIAMKVAPKGISQDEALKIAEERKSRYDAAWDSYFDLGPLLLFVRWPNAKNFGLRFIDPDKEFAAAANGWSVSVDTKREAEFIYVSSQG